MRGSKVVITRVKSRSLRGSKVVGLCAGCLKNRYLFTKAWVKGRVFAFLRGSYVLCTPTHRQWSNFGGAQTHERGSYVAFRLWCAQRHQKNILKPQYCVCDSLRWRDCVGQKSYFGEVKAMLRGSKIASSPLKTGIAWVKDRNRCSSSEHRVGQKSSRSAHH